MNVRERQDAIVRFMRRSGSTTIDTLADDVGASRRTILRDIASLRDQGFIIHSEAGRGGGLYLDPQSVQTTARLTVQEVFALLISVASMRAAGNLPFSSLADAGLAKIEKSLPSDKVRDLRRILDCLWVGPLAPEVNISDVGEMDENLLAAFETAFLERKAMQFQYRDAKGKLSKRKVEPQAMLILPPLWYLVAWDSSVDDFRHFRTDRIGGPKCVGERQFMRRHVTFPEDVRQLRYL